MTAIISTRTGDDGLSMTWADGHSQHFAYVWLRDNAREARHRNGQKIIETADIPLDIKPQAVSVGPPLTIHWPNDPQPASYDADWLRRRNRQPRARRKLWRAEDIQRALPRFSLPACQASDTVLCQMLDAVQTLGFAIIDSIPTHEQSLFAIIDLFGYVRETNYGRLFDVRVQRNPNNLAFTSGTLSAHTDNPYRDPVPGLQLLHVLENSAEGGENTLVDGLSVAEQLRKRYPDAFTTLANTPVDFRFQSDDADLHNRTTLIGLDDDGCASSVRFNNRSMQALELSTDATHDFYTAHRHFSLMLEDTQNKIVLKLAAGEAMLFDNTRILHGRLGYTGEGHRHLQGCYADMDSLTSKLRVLQRKCGSDANP